VLRERTKRGERRGRRDVASVWLAGFPCCLQAGLGKKKKKKKKKRRSPLTESSVLATRSKKIGLTNDENKTKSPAKSRVSFFSRIDRNGVTHTHVKEVDPRVTKSKLLGSLCASHFLNGRGQ
jgi:hypothetical protein